MDADAVFNGRHVAEGEKIGVVSKLSSTTPTAPHAICIFDVQCLPPRRLDLVNPYVTLISAYERLNHAAAAMRSGPRSRPLRPCACCRRRGHPSPIRQEANDNSSI